MPAISSVTGELAAVGSRKLGPPEVGVTYVAVLAGPVAPFQPSESLKSTATDSDPSEPVVSPETANRRMTSDMSGPLIDKPDGTTQHDQVTNNGLPAGQRSNNTPIFITGASDTWLRASGPDGPTKGREVDGRPINRRRVQSLGQRTAAP